MGSLTGRLREDYSWCGPSAPPLVLRMLRALIALFMCKLQSLQQETHNTTNTPLKENGLKAFNLPIVLE